MTTKFQNWDIPWLFRSLLEKLSVSSIHLYFTIVFNNSNTTNVIFNVHFHTMLRQCWLSKHYDTLSYLYSWHFSNLFYCYLSFFYFGLFLLYILLSSYSLPISSYSPFPSLTTSQHPATCSFFFYWFVISLLYLIPVPILSASPFFLVLQLIYIIHLVCFLILPTFSLNLFTLLKKQTSNLRF